MTTLVGAAAVSLFAANGVLSGPAEPQRVTVQDSNQFAGNGTENDPPADPNASDDIREQLGLNGKNCESYTDENGENPTTACKGDPPPIGEKAWRQAVLDAARKALDPQGEFLSIGQNLSSSGTGSGRDGIGTSMGWASKGDSGLGAVTVEILAPGAKSDSLGLCEGFGPCENTAVPGGGTAQIARSGNGDFEVVFQQADGETVNVEYVGTWGNNSLTPTDSAGPSVDDVLKLVTSDQLNLP
ncbi:MAG: hypothetical protein ACRCYU_20085 [Nocardioides sp.]